MQFAGPNEKEKSCTTQPPPLWVQSQRWRNGGSNRCWVRRQPRSGKLQSFDSDEEKLLIAEKPLVVIDAGDIASSCAIHSGVKGNLEESLAEDVGEQVWATTEVVLLPAEQPLQFREQVTARKKKAVAGVEL